ncbi:hypothetical protein CAEBREN_11671 [Caenorhabditis brenneri]|uniref:Uncharacterized protein n=1 Tax=Caenorhabditis brenneri TaxID=135651 RepID=G0NJ63_CAEBE|nr:hypothetical protein CAEBREN_11671 [Caenorhabditis brenneri]
MKKVKKHEPEPSKEKPVPQRQLVKRKLEPENVVEVKKVRKGGVKRKHESEELDNKKFKPSEPIEPVPPRPLIKRKLDSEQVVEAKKVRKGGVKRKHELEELDNKKFKPSEPIEPVPPRPLIKRKLDTESEVEVKKAKKGGVKRPGPTVFVPVEEKKSRIVSETRGVKRPAQPQNNTNKRRTLRGGGGAPKGSRIYCRLLKAAIKDAYTNIDNPTAYTSINNVFKALKPRFKSLKKEQVEKELEDIEAFTLHRPTRKRFPRRETTGYGLYLGLQADLVDLAKHKKENDGVTFLLTMREKSFIIHM